MNGHNDANEDPNGGDDAQDWHVKNNAALFQPWQQTIELKVQFLWWNLKNDNCIYQKYNFYGEI